MFSCMITIHHLLHNMPQHNRSTRLYGSGIQAYTILSHINAHRCGDYSDGWLISLLSTSLYNTWPLNSQWHIHLWTVALLSFSVQLWTDCSCWIRSCVNIFRHSRNSFCFSHYRTSLRLMTTISNPVIEVFPKDLNAEVTVAIETLVSWAVLVTGAPAIPAMKRNFLSLRSFPLTILIQTGPTEVNWASRA